MTRISCVFPVLALLLAGCSSRTDFHQTLRTANVQSLNGGPVLLAAYQPWFGREGHMDVGYSTQDPEVLRRQVREAKDLGIAGFVVNWYGPSKDFEDRSYAKLQAIAAEGDFKVSLMYDEHVDDPQRATEEAINDLQYAYDRYIGPAAPNRDSYLLYDGRPVIFIFPKDANTDWARVRQAVNQWERPPVLLYKDVQPNLAQHFDGFYAWVHPGKKGWSGDGSNWGRQYLETFYREMTGRFSNKLAVGAAWPGFDDTRASWSRNRRMDSRCGRTFADSLRLFRRYYGESRELPFLMIVTWNDYEEGTAIERGLTGCDAQRAANGKRPKDASN